MKISVTLTRYRITTIELTPEQVKTLKEGSYIYLENMRKKTEQSYWKKR